MNVPVIEQFIENVLGSTNHKQLTVEVTNPVDRAAVLHR
jgi:hypothetical protein